jgi:putative cardiolipin synthase
VVTPLPTPEGVRQSQKALEAFAADPSHYPPGFQGGSGDIDAAMTSLDPELLWGRARLLVDAVPEKSGKAQTHAEFDRTGVALGRVLAESTQEVLVESAYLILLDGGFAAFDALTGRGATLKLATNSMASNNHLTAFVGYAKQREKLLATGAELYEMRPDAEAERALFTAAQLDEHQTSFGLHAKTAVFDRKVTFVGSFNLDPRSVNLNTEMGWLVESETLSNAVADSIENDIAGGNSWRVVGADAGGLEWVTLENGVVTTETETEPMTTPERRAAARLLAVVPDDAQL